MVAEAKNGIVTSPFDPNKKKNPRKMSGSMRSHAQRTRRKPKATFSSRDSSGCLLVTINHTPVLLAGQISRVL